MAHHRCLKCRRYKLALREEDLRFDGSGRADEQRAISEEQNRIERETVSYTHLDVYKRQGLYQAAGVPYFDEAKHGAKWFTGDEAVKHCNEVGLAGFRIPDWDDRCV